MWGSWKYSGCVSFFFGGIGEKGGFVLGAGDKIKEIESFSLRVSRDWRIFSR